MPRTFVALDLETTGLNPERDTIIEVGAVKFRDGEPVEEFSSLVDPGRPVPYEIQQLTGITDGDVAGQPRFAQIAADLMRFIGSHPLVAHSVNFDLGFLRAQGLAFENAGLDTFELASILLPGLPSYSLAALLRYHDLQRDHEHRALHDARAAGELFLRLCDRAARLPRTVLLEINRIAQGSRWPLAPVFAEALASLGGVARRPDQEMSLDQLAPDSPLLQSLRLPEPLVPRERPQPVDDEELSELLSVGGCFSRAFPGYEFRPPQVEMLRAVAGAFNQQHHMLAEAGTGTGKSLAYLLPAIAYAVKNGVRVVVSTNTINLQDQLYNKDLPTLQHILGEVWGKQVPFRAALLKGRSNYLCPRRFAALKNRANLSLDELRGIVRILVWLPTTQTGDQSELSLPWPSDRFVWSQVCAENEGCSLDRCQREQRGRCFFYRARRHADAAHVIVVNHALLLADAATENRVLPEYHHLIVDEAHHLEDAVTEQLSFRADNQSLSQAFDTIHPAAGELAAPAKAGRSTVRAGGLLGDCLVCLRQGVPEELQTLVREHVLRLQADLAAVRSRLDDFWEVLEGVLRNLRPSMEKTEYDARVRITEAARTQSYWVEIEVSWENLAVTWQHMLKRLDALIGGMQDLQAGGFDPPGLERLLEDLTMAERRLETLYLQMEAWATKPDRNGIYWAEISQQSSRISLHTAPLHVGPLVQEHILFRNNTVVLTSATLRTAGSFDYLRDRLHCYEADTITVGSPFDYEASTLLYLPADLPEPTASGYQSAVEGSLSALVKALDGRTLALFTSYAQLRRTTQALARALAGTGISVLSQSNGTSRHQLLEVFKTTSRCVLLGTRSFWEGVDVVGPSLSALVLVRLPFAVPSDPVVAARSETFDDPFLHYSIPDAILRFRQGFGRLIRSKSDRGVVVVLDKRVQTKAYGQLFLESLPECTVHRGPLMNLPSAALRWIDGS